MCTVLLNFHTEDCERRAENNKNHVNEYHRIYADYCTLNPEKVVFFWNGNFYVLEYYNCHTEGCYNKPEFYEKIIKSISTNKKSVKVTEGYKIERQHLKDDLKDLRYRGIALKKWIAQVNFIYYDNAGKKYGVTTQSRYVDAICQQDLINESLDKAIKEIEDKHNNSRYLINQLKELWLINQFVDHREYSDKYVVNCIDDLISTINKHTK